MNGGNEPISLMESNPSQGVPGLLPRCGASSWLSFSKELLYIFGGRDEEGRATSTLQRIHLLSTVSEVQHFAKEPPPRYFHASSVHPSKTRCYTYGGATGTGSLLNDLWVHDRDGRWSEVRCVGDGPGRRYHHQLAFSACGTWMYVIGGSAVVESVGFLGDVLPSQKGLDGPHGSSSSTSALKETLRGGGGKSARLLNSGAAVNGEEDFELPRVPDQPMYALNLVSSTWFAMSTPPELLHRRGFTVQDVTYDTARAMNAASPSVAGSPRFQEEEGQRTQLYISPGASIHDDALLIEVQGAEIRMCTRCPCPPLTDFETSHAVNNLAAARRMDRTTVYVAANNAEVMSPSEFSTQSMPSFGSRPAAAASGRRESLLGGSMVRRKLSMFAQAVVQKRSHRKPFFEGPQKVGLFIEFGGHFESYVPLRQLRGVDGCSPAEVGHFVLRQLQFRSQQQQQQQQEDGDGEPDEPSSPALTAADGLTWDIASEVRTFTPTAPSMAASQATSQARLDDTLTRLTGATAVDLSPTISVVSMGRDALTGTMSRQIYILDKTLLVERLRNPVIVESLGRLTRRQSTTRLQMIMATMGSSAKLARRLSMRRIEQESARREATGEERRLASLESYSSKVQRDAAEVEQREANELAEFLAKMIQDDQRKNPTLFHPNNNNSSVQQQQQAVTAKLRERIAKQRTQNVHDHYDEVVKELTKVGLASPLLADETILAAETAFYFRQTQRQKVSLPNRSNEVRQHEWFHPPNVTRANEKAQQSLALRGVYRSVHPPSSTRSRPNSARGPAPLPMMLPTDARSKQILAEYRREEVLPSRPQSGRPSTHFTRGNNHHSNPKKGISPLISQEALMTVNAKTYR